MAKVSTVNNLPATGGAAMFLLHNFLRDLMGFTIAISGDGLSAFNSSGTSVITSGGSGANGMNNTDAHFTARDPASGWEWCVQRNASSIDWEIVVSALDGFTGGSATARPTATDQQTLFNSSILDADGAYRVHIVGNTTPVTGVYPWWFGTITTGAGGVRALIAHEPLIVGSYPALVGTRATPTTGEPDPCIYIAGGPSDSIFRINAAGWQLDAPPNPVRHWYAMNGSNGQTESFDFIQGITQSGNASVGDVLFPATSTQGVGVSPLTSADPMITIGLGREVRQARPLFKGFTATMRMKGVQREYPDTLDLGGERFVYMGDLLLPFANGATPLT